MVGMEEPTIDAESPSALRRWGIPFAVVGVVVAGIIVWTSGADTEPVAAGPSAPTSFDTEGKLQLNLDERTWSMAPGEPCSGSGGYADIKAGAQVVIRDWSARTIASGSLSSSELGLDRKTCTFDFSVLEVPIQDDNIYSVEVSHRGQIVFKQADADGLSLSLGA